MGHYLAMAVSLPEQICHSIMSNRNQNRRSHDFQNPASQPSSVTDNPTEKLKIHKPPGMKKLQQNCSKFDVTPVLRDRIFRVISHFHVLLILIYFN
jgi:hypothetical protein